MISAIQRLIQPRAIEQVGLGLIVSVAASLINFSVARILLRAGQNEFDGAGQRVVGRERAEVRHDHLHGALYLAQAIEVAFGISDRDPGFSDAAECHDAHDRQDDAGDKDLDQRESPPPGSVD